MRQVEESNYCVFKPFAPASDLPEISLPIHHETPTLRLLSHSGREHPRILIASIERCFSLSFAHYGAFRPFGQWECLRVHRRAF